MSRAPPTHPPALHAAQVKALQGVLKPLLLRRMKEDVETLPEKEEVGTPRLVLMLRFSQAAPASATDAATAAALLARITVASCAWGLLQSPCPCPAPCHA
jgi:hypothetical protein